MRGHVRVIILVSLLMLPVPALSSGAEESDQAPYKPGAPSTAICDGGLNAGGACMALPPGTQEAEVHIQDDLVPSVAAAVWFGDHQGPMGPTQTVCGHATLEVPPGATEMIVIVTEHAATLACDGASAPGTSGLITAYYR